MLNNKVIWSIKSECGPLRDKNEDSVYPHSSGKSMLPFKAGVFDGMGGHRSGEIASKIASETMNENFDSLDLYINEANKEILSHQNSNPETYGMGTTMTVIEITEDLLLKIAHVGDSRCYVFSDNKLFLLTEDDNLPENKNILTQALGTKEKLNIQTRDYRLKKYDTVFVCTDGVYNEISDEYIKNKLSEGISADTLIGEILIQEPKDNLSAIIINVM
jgi:serine/threonine protein phosphatase PrpC